MTGYDTIIFSRSHKGPGALLYSAPGIHRIATEIRNHGMTCQLVQHMNWFTDEEYKKLLPNLIGSSTKIIGFSTTFWRHAGPDIAETIHIVNIILDYITDYYPNIKVIAGGSEAYHTTKKYFKKIDAVFLEFPEDILSKYLIAIRDNMPLPLETEICSITNAKIYKTDNKNFNFSHSKIKYEPNDYITPRSTVNIEVGRGCVFKCKFCSFKLNGKKKFDYLKDAEVLRDELIDNYNNYKIQTYILTDDTFNDSTYKIEKLHKIFTTLPFKIYFSAYLRLDLLNAHPEQIPLLKEMGLRGAFFGIESFHSKAASNIGKGLNSEIAKKLLHELKTIHWGDEVKINTSFIVGLPYETLESYEETKKWITDPNNFIDKIPVYPLHITNPASAYQHDNNLSEFALNAMNNGFYWTKEDSSWKNINGPIKTFDEAQRLCTEFETLTTSVNKHEYRGSSVGAFEIFISWNSNPTFYKDLSFIDLLNMPKDEYIKWKSMKDISKMIQQYKNKLLNNDSTL